MKKICFILVIFLGFIPAKAQKIRTQNEVIQLVLQNNYDVLVSVNEIETAKNNTSIYNTGYLPTVTTSASATYDENNVDAETQEGDPFVIDGAVTENYNATVSLNYTVFDGFNRRYNFKKLQETQGLTELQARQTIENTLLQVYTSYFEIARLSENTKNLSETLAISRQRLERTQYNFEFGQATKLDVLTAEVDRNNDSISYLDSQRLLKNAKRDLNILMGTDVSEINYEVDTNIDYTFDLTLEDLQENLQQNNVQLLQIEKNIAINAYDIKMNKSGWLPTISADGSYSVGRSNSDQAFAFASQTTNGFGVGLNLTWDVFDGGKTKTRVQNAKIALDSENIRKQQTSQQLLRDLNNTWETYQNALYTIRVQEMNLETNVQSFQRTEEQYKLGQVITLDFRQAQINLLNAKLNLSQAKYDAKNSELQLLQMAGKLLK
ncbi:outer membrane protein TolC [Kordia sp. SMS9]|uniref:TolC family protein n=1 Tax=Kordia sp. SMS9 TaxID=2282170 RepID=UPI000E0D0BF8|nr:TolC family protein [Kordia sp. SMS9]AXG69211.1 outer membrane protein TolC [Kordia sp. SMS9]